MRHETQLLMSGVLAAAGMSLSALEVTSPSGHIAGDRHRREVVQNTIDGKADTKWFVVFAPNMSWQLKLDAPVAIQEYTFTSANDSPGRDPKSWILEGSSDGNVWNRLDERKDQVRNPARFTAQTYRFSNTTAYLFYRIRFLENHGDTYFQLAEIRLGPEGLIPVKVASMVPQMENMWGDVKTDPKVSTAKARFFKEAKYAMFIHWGLYSQAANNWKGRPFYGISEWMMAVRRIPVGDYEALAREFNPEKFDAKQWAALAKAAGMKYLVITAKHHEGFAMFKSSHPYNIVDATPFKRDPLKELAAACREAGIGFGVYYSQFQDWHEINNWDSKAQMPFSEYFEKKCLPQIRELLTNYGPLTMIWFDTPGKMTPAQSGQIVELMRELQPNALINSRIGNGVGDYSTLSDHELPSRRRGGLWESIDTTNNSWGYAGSDTNFLSESEVLRRLITVIARGGNYMLNVGPDGSGTIPEIAAETLRKAGTWIARNSDAVYGAQPSPWDYPMSWGDCTRQGKKLFFHVFCWRPGGQIAAYGLGSPVEKVSWRTASGRSESLRFTAENNWLRIELPMRKSQSPVEVIEVELASETPDALPRIGIDPELATILPADLASAENCKVQRQSWMEKFGEWKHIRSLGSWQENGKAVWEIDVLEPGLYEFAVTYNHVRHRVWEVTTEEGQRIEFWARNAGGKDGPKRFVSFPAGVLEFRRAGAHKLTFAPVMNAPQDDPINNGGIDLHALTVKRYR